MEAERYDGEEIARRQQEQVLKLVTKGFYNELVNYGVRKQDILTIASHLLDHVIQQEVRPHKNGQFYNRLFTTATIRDAWRDEKRLEVGEVSIEPLRETRLGQVVAWLSAPAIQASFATPYPGTEEGLRQYFGNPGRLYFSIAYQGQPVGIIGAENMDLNSRRLEMRKLVGKPELRGRGIGKRATFAFLYYVFMILNFEKVYIHSTDVNIRNLNLNSQFGFQLEGVFLQEISSNGGRADMVRMGLLRRDWLEIFSAPVRAV